LKEGRTSDGKRVSEEGYILNESGTPISGPLRDDQYIHKVISAGNKFIVYEDGKMVATDGEFTGTIYATGGKIGNMEIESLIDPGYEVSIEVKNNAGTVFESGETSKTLVAYLYKNGSIVTTEITGYQWSKNGQDIPGATS
jgi:hypothetical protein